MPSANHFFIEYGGIDYRHWDYIVDYTSWNNHDWYMYHNDASYNLNFLLEKAIIVFFIPLIEQIFFTGLILQSLLKKTNPSIAIYAASAFYTLFAFNITLGKFGLGLIASILFSLTGTLYASIIFHISCLVGWELLANAYPRLIIFFGFFLFIC